MTFKALAAFPELTASVKEVELTDGSASWYRIGSGMSNEVITAERPENSTVCVYNKYFELVYTTHVTDCKNEIDLPEDGYIMFAGQTGGSVKISR